MPNIEARGLHFEYQLGVPEGLPDAPLVLLIMGLGMQLTAWPGELLERFHRSGFRTLVYDQRDLGLSSRMDQAGRPNFVWAFIKKRLGLRLSPPYRLSDLAEDALAIAERLGIAKMHVVGVSMGGMVAQHIAAGAPERVLSLSLLMSSSGAPGLPGADRAVAKVMLARMPESHDEAALVERFVRLFQVIGSPRYPTSEAVLRSRAQASVRRATAADGTLRQMLAILADGDRSLMLASISAPTLVLHGAADPLLPPACGAHLAGQIAQAELVLIEGMGHDLPDQLIGEIAGRLIQHCLQNPG